MTYDNSILPEALLLAYLVIRRKEYKETAQRSFDFLLQHIFTDNQIRVISNQGWLFKGKGSHPYGEQPVDVAGTVITLNLFYKVFSRKQAIFAGKRMRSTGFWETTTCTKLSIIRQPEAAMTGWRKTMST